MSGYISSSIRTKVAERAGQRCEYCGLPAEYSFFKFHIDHIVSLKHGGKTMLENLAYSCSICNEFKGTDIATVLDDPSHPVRFFNPRKDKWDEHFEVEDSAKINPKSLVGAATVKIFNLNHPDSIIERRGLMQLGLYP
ncbi:MAG: HNH endonuclease [Saprospiraceae bacterium]|nr:HNH endonuclease [Saprospiraceae bacterium]